MTTIAWQDGWGFVEVALALAIPTDHIMASYNAGGPLTTVIYTPKLEDEADPPVWCACLWRGADGQLVVERNDDTGRRASSFLPEVPDE